MRQTHQTRLLDHAIEEVFDYVADFSRTPEWDPSVVDARRLDSGPIRQGSRFRVSVRLGGRVQELEYALLEHAPPHRLVLRGTGPTSVATDHIAFDTAGPSVTRIDWRLEVQMQGVGRVVEPFMGPMLNRLGRKALDGLVERMRLPLPRRAPGVEGAR